jgi:MoaA/NifB/PqqE/SkfB family radical SAM enzyme
MASSSLLARELHEGEKLAYAAASVRDVERLNPQFFEPDTGFAYVAELGTRFPPGDTLAAPAASHLALYEDGKPLTPHALHTTIRERGAGQFSHWRTTLYFSSTDNTDPRRNGRVYTVEMPLGPASYVPPPVSHQKRPWTCEQAWRNFFVNQLGEVRVCCSNDTLIGNLNRSSFAEIWSSYTLAHMRSLQLAGDYASSSCRSDCHQLIHRFPETYQRLGPGFPGYKPDARTGDAWLDALPASPFAPPRDIAENLALSAQELDAEICRTVSMPTRGLIVPIAKCNLYCPFCDTGVAGGAVPNDLISERALDGLSSVYPFLEYLEIVGSGEIFYYPPAKSPMRQILEDIRRYSTGSMHVMLLTNGVALKKPWIDEIIRTDVVTELAVSIDTIDPETYKIVRKGGSIENLKRNLDYMEEEKQKRGRSSPRWRFNIVVSDLTMRHLPETLEYIQRYDPSQVFFLPLVPGGETRYFREHHIFRPERRDELLRLRSIIDGLTLTCNRQEILSHIENSLAFA